MKHPPIPQTEVLAWLQANHAPLHAVAVIDRSWIWLPVDLRGDDKKPVRESIKEYGFRFSKRGHPLSTGQSGTWSHSCERPMPFKRRGQSRGTSQVRSTTETVTTTHEQTQPETDSSLAEALAFVNS